MSASNNNDYKNTLNLPNTSFPMKANLPQREPEQLKKWNEHQLYQKIRSWAKGRDKFILHDGPPYANGTLHIGHALNKVLKDIIIKSKTLNGYDCPYVPGWDCHGLPIEREVEKKRGRAGDKLSLQEFRQTCREFAAAQIITQKQVFVRLGVFADWDNPYLTMDFKFEADIIRALKEIYKNGHLHQGYKPVHWCTDCRSSLAEAEVEYANKTSPSIDVKFLVVDEETCLNKFDANKSQDNNLGHGPISVLIWTTTPWTLPANRAVALSKDVNYVLVQAHGERFVVAKELVANLTQRYGIKLEILAEVIGEELELLNLYHPFEERQVPIILGEHVTLDGGTGCVHTAPGHGPDDYIVGLKYNLSIDHAVLGSGVFGDDVPFVGGQHVFKANQVIVDLLKEKNKLVFFNQIEHSYPHCWRHKTPIIFRATPQWFISMSARNLRNDALAAIKNVKWIPESGYNRIEKMVEQRPDWCISRQRTWCVPMPLFINQKTKELHPKTAEIMEYIALQVEQSGIDAWYQVDRVAVLEKFSDHTISIGDYEASNDTLDVWFDSGVTHYAVLKNNSDLAWPADLYLEGSDQHRGWFGSSLMTGVSLYKQAPYKQVLTHGYTVDAKGYKMSKSLGNIVVPQDINNKFGTDVLRLWVAGTDYRGDVAVSDEIFNRTSDVYRRIRNTARFLLANLNGFQPERDLLKFEQLIHLDRWAIKRAVELQKEIIADYENYAFRGVFQKIHDFCSIDMGGFYLDIIKDRQYTTKADSLARRSAQTAIYYIIKMLAQWSAPILSFTAEEIWQNIPKDSRDANNSENFDSIFLTTWEKNLDIQLDSKFSMTFWHEIVTVKVAINKELEKLRASGVIGSGLQAEVEIYASEPHYSMLKMLCDELRFVLITSTAKVYLLEDNTALNDEFAATDLENIRVKIQPSANNKCVRCWHYCADVGQNTEHSELCGRCVTNVVGEGEVRLYA